MSDFTKIDGAHAITRTSAGIYSKTDVYHLGKDVFTPSSKGYAKLSVKHFAEGYTTSQASLRVIDIAGEGLIRHSYGISYDPTKVKKKAANDRG